MLIGYARVSMLDQDPALQIDALNSTGCERVFEEKASGAQRDRPQLQAALEYMRDGDTLVVWKLDRLARSLKHLFEKVEDLRDRGIGFRSLTESLDTTGAGGDWSSTSSVPWPSSSRSHPGNEHAPASMQPGHAGVESAAVPLPYPPMIWPWPRPCSQIRYHHGGGRATAGRGAEHALPAYAGRAVSTELIALARRRKQPRHGRDSTAAVWQAQTLVIPPPNRGGSATQIGNVG